MTNRSHITIRNDVIIIANFGTFSYQCYMKW